jgi:hypothetical protein
MVFHETEKEKEYCPSQSEHHRLFYVEWCRYNSVPIHTKAEVFCEFLMAIRDSSPLNRICLVLDNFSTHKAKGVKEKARELN